MNADDSVTAKGTDILQIGFMGRRELLDKESNARLLLEEMGSAQLKPTST